LSTKKRANGEEGEGARPAKKRTTQRPTRPTRAAPRAAAGAKPASKPASRSTPKPTAKPARRVVRSAAPQPRIRASHGSVPDAPSSHGSHGDRRLKALRVDTGAPARREIKPKVTGEAGGTAIRKAQLAGPKRAVPRKAAAPDAAPGPSSEARELAVALAAAAIDKKAIGIEILDVTGKVDYADFLVVMTGRSDRHVHSIATGIEEAMRARKVAPLSMEGLTAASWVLIDFGEVVVHVFQEEARALYDIEGLWIDAGRVPVPAHEGPGALPSVD